TLANLEIRDGLLRARYHGLLTGDLSELGGGRVEQLHVGARFAEADIDRHFLHTRHSHVVFETKALCERRHGFFAVLVMQTGDHSSNASSYLGCSASILCFLEV